MNKKHTIDIMGIILGIIVGTLLGYFLSSKVNLDDNEKPVIGEVETKEDGYIYLLQIAKFDNPTGASNYMEALEKNGFYSIYVYEDCYYIYGGISLTLDGLSGLKSSYEIKGYTPLIKKEYILDLPNKVIENNYQYNFWSEGIQNFLKTFKNESVEISDMYYTNYVNLELITNLTMIDKLKSSDDKSKLQLQTYKNIVENLK